MLVVSATSFDAGGPTREVSELQGTMRFGESLSRLHRAICSTGDNINQAYTEMAAKRCRQAKWARRNRVLKMTSSDEMAQRLRVLASVFPLQSTQGTSLETCS